MMGIDNYNANSTSLVWTRRDDWNDVGGSAAAMYSYVPVVIAIDRVPAAQRTSAAYNHLIRAVEFRQLAMLRCYASFKRGDDGAAPFLATAGKYARIQRYLQKRQDRTRTY